MKKLVYGTHNPSKIAQVQELLRDLGITVTGLGSTDTRVEEDGKTAEENARKKAQEYARLLNDDVLSMDTGLYFEELPDHLQPGLYVRRILGNDSASDQEIIEYYINLISKYDGKLHGYWEFSYAISSPTGQTDAFTARTASRVFINKPHATILPGYPLSSLQLDSATGEYVLDVTHNQPKSYDETMNTTLVNFIKNHYQLS